jgi:DNA-binding MarR family transcriptional regulator
MTQNAAPPPSFGQAVAETARQLRKVHHRALADFDTDFPTWMLFTVLTEKGGPLPVDDVVRELGRRIDLTEPDVRQVLDRAAAEGHVRYEGHVAAEGLATAELTGAGAARFADVYAHARTATDAALDGIDPATLGSALNVLVTVEQHATALLGER